MVGLHGSCCRLALEEAVSRPRCSPALFTFPCLLESGRSQNSEAVCSGFRASGRGRVAAGWK